MSYDMLFSPIVLNQMELKNRVVMAPIHEEMGSEDGFVTDELIDFYLRRAKGGASMITIGAIMISQRATPRHRFIYDDKFIPGLMRLTTRMHSDTDARICAQLFDWLPGPRDRLRDVNDVTIEEIEEIIDKFDKAAVRAKEAGFDAIEIHAAHCTGLSSFLSLRNKRNDRYGGPVENRIRIVAEIYQRMRSALGKDYPIGIRINGDDFIVEGNTLTHSRIIATKLAEMGIDYISVSGGAKFEDIPGLTPAAGRLFPYPPTGGYSGFRAFPTAYMPEGVNVYLAEDIRKTLRQAGHTTAVMTAGRISSPDFAEAALQQDKADLIGLCRPLLRDPDWPLKAKKGRAKDIARCEFCNVCSERLSRTEPAYCKYEKGEEELQQLRVALGLVDG